MATIINGEAWVNEKYVPVTFIKAKDCDNDSNNFEKVLKSDDEACVLDSEVYSTYMKFNVGYHHDFGQGFWQGGRKKGERGATEFYYAKVKYVFEE